MKKNYYWRIPVQFGVRKKSLFAMKILATLFLTFMLTSNVFSQTKLTLNFKNASFLEVIQEIESKTDLGFIYNQSDIKKLDKININFDNVSIVEVLNSILLNSDLEYEIDKDIIIIRPKKVEAIQKVDKKKKAVKGKVVNQEGLPLPGVSVVIKGTVNGVATDINGEYFLDLEREEVVLTYSFIGMISQEILYSGQNEINVTLLAEVSNISEVVVTGYQSISKERATGAFEKVDSKVLEEKITFNVLDKLEGQTTGVLYDEFGNITIRGVSTLNGNSNPLIVVDGFPIEGNLETLNPDDIESITILKDAAAASIWGARAANGVVVITSKVNKQIGKPKVEFTSSLSITGEPDLDDQPVASTESFLELEKFLADNGWQGLDRRGPDQNGNFRGRQYPITQGLYTYLRLNDNQISEVEANKIINDLKKVDVRDEFADLFLRKKVRQHYNLTISGAGERNNYLLSLAYDNNDDYSKGADNDRLIANMRVKTDLNDRISVNAGISATLRNTYNNGVSIRSLTELPQYQTIIDDEGNLVPQPKTYFQPTKDALVAKGYPYNWDYNLYQEYKNRDNTTKENDLRMNVGVEIKLTKGLSFQGRFQHERGNIKGERLENENTYSVRNHVNSFTSFDSNNKIITSFPKGHIFSEDYSSYKSFTTRGQLNLDQELFNGKHKITAIAGVEVRKNTSDYSFFQHLGYDPQSLQFVSVNHSERYPRAIGSSQMIPDLTEFKENEDRFISYYTNAAYTFNDKYTITGSARLDDSNLFGANSKYRNVPLWSTGVNWQLHKEDFITSDFINRLVFRATYGTNGNVIKSTSPFLILNVEKEPRDEHLMGKVQNPKNTTLRWEKTAVLNFGVDYALWNNRVSGSVEYYSKKSSDLLGNVSLNSTYGFSSALINFADMSNKGIDASVNVRLINKGLKWNAIVNFSYNKNRVEKVEVPDETVASYINAVARVGKPLGHMYSYRWAGLSNNGFPQIYNENGEAIDHTTELTDYTALKYEGTTTPKYYGSVQNVVSYKNLNLRMLLTYKLGHKFRVPTINYSSLSSPLNRGNWVHEDFDRRWKKPGDESSTDVPVLPTNRRDITRYFNPYTALSDNLVESASHIRFKEVILSYNLPKKWFKSLSMQSLTLGVQARNLGVITFNDSGIDPENIPVIGGLGDIKPEYTFSLKATF